MNFTRLNVSVDGYEDFFVTVPPLYTVDAPIDEAGVKKSKRKALENKRTKVNLNLVPSEEGGWINQSYRTGIFILIDKKEFRVKTTRYSGATIDSALKKYKAALMTGDKKSQEDVIRLLDENEMKTEKIRQRYGLFLMTKWTGKRWVYMTHYKNTAIETYRGGPYKLPNSEKEGFEKSPAQIASELEAIGERIKVISSKDEILRIEEKEKFYFSFEGSKMKLENVFYEPVVDGVRLTEMDGFYEEEADSPEHKQWWFDLREEVEKEENLRNWISALAAVLLAADGGKKIFLVCNENRTRRDFGCGRKDCHMNVIKSFLVNIIASEKNPVHELAVETAKQIKMVK